jgi:Mn-containing catalase
MFMKALDAMGKLDEPFFGNVQPDETVSLYYNLSSNGVKDERGPWNSDENFEYVSDPEAKGKQIVQEKTEEPSSSLAM